MYVFSILKCHNGPGHRLRKHLKWGGGHRLKWAPATTGCIYISCFCPPPQYGRTSTQITL